MTTRDENVVAESESEPGSHWRVQRNKHGIVTAQDMELAESQALWLAQKGAIENYAADHRFTAEDVCSFHRSLLGPNYSWAGDCRTVNINIGGCHSPHPPVVSGFIRTLSRRVLA